MTSYAPLNRIRFGHEHKPPINVRKTDRMVGIDTLAATIKKKGLIQPLGVMRNEADALWYVAAGNRRLAALQKLEKEKAIPADYAVPIHELKDEDFGRLNESSLIENIERVPLHPVDEYEAYASLATSDSPLSEEEIAETFGVKLKHVQQRMALGNLHADIRDAWRKGSLRNDQAMAFTLSRDPAEQLRVYKSLKRSGGLWESSIKKALGVDFDLTTQLTFVGKDVYTKAGGKLTEDLFDGQPAISSPDILKKLAIEKRKAITDALIKEGWSWAGFDNDLPSGASWSWRQAPEADGKRTPAALKEGTGVIIEMRRDGSLQYKYGVLKPGTKLKNEKTKKSAASAKGGATGTGGAGISKSLNTRLSEQLTLAVQEALPSSPHVALAALLAGLAASPNGPIEITMNGYDPSGPKYGRKTEKFEAVFERLLAMKPEELLKAVGPAMSRAISMRQLYSDKAANSEKENAPLLTAMDPAALDKALKARFNAEDYFSSASAAFVMKAIEESLGPDEAARQKSLKKPALAKFAIKNVPPTGWLPAELRTVHYKPPRDLPAKPAKAKAAKPAKAKKKAA